MANQPGVLAHGLSVLASPPVAGFSFDHCCISLVSDLATTDTLGPSGANTRAHPPSVDSHFIRMTPIHPTPNIWCRLVSLVAHFITFP